MNSDDFAMTLLDTVSQIGRSFEQTAICGKPPKESRMLAEFSKFDLTGSPYSLAKRKNEVEPVFWFKSNEACITLRSNVDTEISKSVDTKVSGRSLH